MSYIFVFPKNSLSPPSSPCDPKSSGGKKTRIFLSSSPSHKHKSKFDGQTKGRNRMKMELDAASLFFSLDKVCVGFFDE